MPCDDIQLERRRGSALRQRGQPAAVGIRQRLIAGDFHPLEGMVRLDLLLHLGLDLAEILGGDAVLEIDVVIEAGLDRRPGGKLSVRPEPQNGGRQHVGGGMADALQLGHLLALLRGFAIFGHIGGQGV